MPGLLKKTAVTVTAPEAGASTTSSTSTGESGSVLPNRKEKGESPDQALVADSGAGTPEKPKPKAGESDSALKRWLQKTRLGKSADDDSAASQTSSPALPPKKKTSKPGRKKAEKVVAATDEITVKEEEPTSSTTKQTASKKEPKKKEGGRLSHKITEYFQVRRSSRKPEGLVKAEAESEMIRRLKCGDESGVRVADVEGKGRGIRADRAFVKGEFVLEYRGELIDPSEARRREEEYGKDASIGCYMYYFKCCDKSYCVDATAESQWLGRLVNHSAKFPNLVTRSLEVGGTARLLLMAKRAIGDGEELLYDYGDRDKDTLVSHPWLAHT